MDNSLPIYEDVDEVVSRSNVASRSEYKALNSQDCVPEEYQLPVLNTDYEPYPESSYKVNKLLNKEVRNLKIYVRVGGVILLLLVLACIVAVIGIVVSLSYASKSYTMYDTLRQQLKKNNIFDQCYAESATCNMSSHYNDAWYSCGTGELNVYKKV